ncbi:MAG: bifunctional folylpolyglutamate synthase/dihydrofolate synthase [Albidovulum sp.]|nr:bifunctional folylpolyglutamate synthase/dihydrofolate synthase [Albidovulum sp.]MDE0532194.1 bifunctional folylpolyglutamate synthase/dihydrofolate synthase [Albidovulum sp.]
MNESESGQILKRLTALYPRRIDLTLDRPKRLLSKLNHPERGLPPIVHIAGTNGKGSTLAMLRAGMESKGLRVHAYISPHLTKFHERIRIAGHVIGESSLARVLQECELSNRGDPITLFEITTCAAFLAFSRVRADYLLLEVGLGGRLDATNIVEDPALTVITPVSLDHQQFLGDGLEQIAFEKAGILKPGVPCVVSRQQPEAMAAIEARATEIGSPLLVQGIDWKSEISNGRLEFRNKSDSFDLPIPKLAGIHQAENAGAAVMALKHLGFGIAEMVAAVTKTDWPARMQKLKSGPLVKAAGASEVWLDGGHNPAAGHALARSLQAMPALDTQLICGMLDSKDIKGFLKSLRSVADKVYGIPIPGEDAALPAHSVAAAASEIGIQSEIASCAEEAASRISENIGSGRILVCGSLYLAGKLLSENA